MVMIGTLGAAALSSLCFAIAGVIDLRRAARTPGMGAWFGWTCLGIAAATMLVGVFVRDGQPVSMALVCAIALPALAATGYSVVRFRAASTNPYRPPDREAAPTSRLVVVDELTASIAHEINQPLGAILSNVDAAEILLEGVDPPLDEVRQILKDIRRDGLRASGAIRNVRALARKRELDFEKLDANAIASGVVDLLNPDLRRRGFSLKTSLLPHAAYLRGDRNYLEQVLLNLVSNAMDAVEALADDGWTRAERPAVLLKVSLAEHGHVQFQVVDAGKGIPSEHLKHLFDSFYTSKPHGMGLGLSISRSIVEAHGGSIQAENNHDGGATFRVTLPSYALFED